LCGWLTGSSYAGATVLWFLFIDSLSATFAGFSPFFVPCGNSFEDSSACEDCILRLRSHNPIATPIARSKTIPITIPAIAALDIGLDGDIVSWLLMDEAVGSELVEDVGIDEVVVISGVGSDWTLKPLM
jgi:hypothetical protein